MGRCRGRGCPRQRGLRAGDRPAGGLSTHRWRVMAIPGVLRPHDDRRPTVPPEPLSETTGERGAHGRVRQGTPDRPPHGRENQDDRDEDARELVPRDPSAPPALVSGGRSASRPGRPRRDAQAVALGLGTDHAKRATRARPSRGRTCHRHTRQLTRRSLRRGEGILAPPTSHLRSGDVLRTTASMAVAPCS